MRRLCTLFGVLLLSAAATLDWRAVQAAEVPDFADPGAVEAAIGEMIGQLDELDPDAPDHWRVLRGKGQCAYGLSQVHGYRSVEIYDAEVGRRSWEGCREVLRGLGLDGEG